MNQLQIKYFLTAARCLNFTEAAKELYISQPALSQQMSALEKELNMQLFIRKKGKLFLTPAAVVLLHDLPKYEDHYVDILKRAVAANEGKTGSLIIGNMEGQSMPEATLKRFFAFKEKHPEIEINIKCYSFGNLKRHLAEDTLDIVYSPNFLLDNIPGYRIETVDINRAHVIISKHHPMAKKRITSLAQLKDETFLFLREKESQTLNEYMLRDCEQAGFVPKIKYVDSLDENIACVEWGLGVGVTNFQSLGCVNPNIKALKQIKLEEHKFVFGWKQNNDNPSIALFINHMLGEDKDFE